MDNWVNEIKTPAYVLDTRILDKNLSILDRVQKEAGCEILMALKGFACYPLFSRIGEVLAGVTSSALFEARLGHEYMGKQVHIYAPAYRDDAFEDILAVSDHIVFNSFNQLDHFKSMIDKAEQKPEIGMRINPEYSEVAVDLYNPCSVDSRLGVKAKDFDGSRIDALDGLHFHALCEQNADTLVNVIKAVESRFGDYLSQVKWVNFGGGHHITRGDYQLDVLIKAIKQFKEKYGVKVYLEPGEAIILNAGFLVASVLDIIPGDVTNVILDTSAACHMPDVIEMPYRPEVIGAKKPGEAKYTYRFGGPSCLSGDIIGDYAFDSPLQAGDKLIFCDMGHYTMVKNNMFNGINLPAIALLDDNGIQVLREFEYDDYRRRLG